MSNTKNVPAGTLFAVNLAMTAQSGGGGEPLKFAYDVTAFDGEHIGDGCVPIAPAMDCDRLPATLGIACYDRHGVLGLVQAFERPVI